MLPVLQRAEECLCSWYSRNRKLIFLEKQQYSATIYRYWSIWKEIQYIDGIHFILHTFENYGYIYTYRTSQVALVVKNPPANAGRCEMQVQSLSWEDPVGAGTATHSSTLAWKIPLYRGSWQAAVHSVAQSWTWLKWLSTRIHVTNITLIHLAKLSIIL